MERNPDELFGILTFSGGGTWVAALVYGVMQQLAHPRIDDITRTLLNEVDVISSVSGGSFTAAYYAPFRERLFASFEKEFLRRNVQGELFGRVILPWNLLRLASWWFRRGDLAVAYYDKHIFRGRTYGDLVDGGRRAFVIPNAADMSFGAPFEFT